MKLTFISDTHSQHDLLPPLGSGDVLVHCGDFTGRGSLDDTFHFATFMAAQPFTHKIVIAGNHDWCLEDKRRSIAEHILKEFGILYLNDSGTVIDGVTFWGSPVQPEFCQWAFNRQRGEAIRKHWNKIPDNTQILITHGPAFGILDQCIDEFHAGCKDLLHTIQRIKPRIHACGHIHEAYGKQKVGETLFINACLLDENYLVRYPPVVVKDVV